jgi:hypothetical protein
MSGAIPPFPNTPWRGVRLQHRDNFNFLPLPLLNVIKVFLTEADLCSGNTVGLYSGDTQFESLPAYRQPD